MDLIKVPQGRDKTFLKHSYPKIVGGTSQMKLFFLVVLLLMKVLVLQMVFEGGFR